jgi:hypothetical protein
MPDAAQSATSKLIAWFALIARPNEAARTVIFLFVLDRTRST